MRRVLRGQCQRPKAKAVLVYPQYRILVVLRSRRVDFALCGESVKAIFGYCVAIGEGGRVGVVGSRFVDVSFRFFLPLFSYYVSLIF